MNRVFDGNLPRDLILGIDIATICTGFAVITPRGEIVDVDYLCISRAIDLKERQVMMIDAIVEHLANVEVVGIEDQFVKSNARTSLKLAEMRGIAKVVCYRGGVAWNNIFDIAPADAKKYLTQHGNASKSDVQKVATALAGRDLTEDEADALAIAFATLGVVKAL